MTNTNSKPAANEIDCTSPSCECMGQGHKRRARRARRPTAATIPAPFETLRELVTTDPLRVYQAR